jgi:hypothetical protein
MLRAEQVNFSITTSQDQIEKWRFDSTHFPG